MSDMVKYRAVSFKKDQIAAMCDIVHRPICISPTVQGHVCCSPVVGNIHRKYINSNTPIVRHAICSRKHSWKIYK